MIKNFRKYRINELTRDIYAETRLSPSDFITPFFVVRGNRVKQEIRSLPGVYHLSNDSLLFEIEALLTKGINKVLLFGVPDNSEKDETGTAAYSEGNLVSTTVTEIKRKFPEVVVFTDICMCGYTSHGHCGILKGEYVNNESTLPYLSKMAVTYAAAGADFVAPSAMMDGQVHAIRSGLDSNKLFNTKILSYSAKYASSFYGPFRDAAHSAPAFGDRKTYQMDYRNVNQAIAEISADIEESADMVMVKPAHTYLDIISKARDNFPEIKIAGYFVSGEYSIVCFASQKGIVDEIPAFREVHTAIKRAGADFIITYYNPPEGFFI